MNRKNLKEILCEVIQRDTRKRSSGSECDLTIDDDFEEKVYDALPKKKLKGIRMAEEPTDLTCRWNNCDMKFNNTDKYTKHILEHTNNVEENEEGYYDCGFKDCTCESLSLNGLIKHTSFHAYHERLKNVGENVAERLKLPKCAQTECFEVPSVTDDYVCEFDMCYLKFNMIHEFLQHIKIHVHRNPKYCKKGEFIYCYWTGCKAKFSTQYRLSDHLRTHTKEKTAACPDCGNLFCSKTKFMDHRKRQIPIDQQSFQCSECLKLFPSEKILRDHMRSHINHYKCSLCDMTCTTPFTLAHHIRHRHLNERPYKCNFCPYGAVSKINLTHHLQTHSAEKLMACDECDFKCRAMVTLDRHYQKKHGQGASYYQCHCCENRYARGASLTKHLIKKHGYSWPSGHSRFRYKEDQDGVFRLQTVRYESLEVTKEMMSKKRVPLTNTKYELKKSENSSTSFVAMPSEEQEKEEEEEEEKEEDIVCVTDKDIILTISDVDSTGNIIKSEVVKSKEIISTDFKVLDNK